MTNTPIGIPSGWEVRAAYYAGMFRGGRRAYWSGEVLSNNYFYLQVAHDWRVVE